MCLGVFDWSNDHTPGMGSGPSLRTYKEGLLPSPSNETFISLILASINPDRALELLLRDNERMQIYGWFEV